MQHNLRVITLYQAMLGELVPPVAAVTYRKTFSLGSAYKLTCRMIDTLIRSSYAAIRALRENSNNEHLYATRPHPDVFALRSFTTGQA